LQVAGCYEFYRLIDRRLFKRRSRLEAELEVLEHRVGERNVAIATLTADKMQLTSELKAARTNYLEPPSRGPSVS
jgi:hypothetical protein